MVIIATFSLPQSPTATARCGEPGRGSDSPPDCHSLPRLRFAYPLHKGAFGGRSKIAPTFPIDRFPIQERSPPVERSMKRTRWILVVRTCASAEGHSCTSGGGAWGFLRERRRARERAYPLGRLLWVLSCSAARKYPSGGTAPKYFHKFTIPQSR